MPFWCMEEVEDEAAWHSNLSANAGTVCSEPYRVNMHTSVHQAAHTAVLFSTEARGRSSTPAAAAASVRIMTAAASTRSTKQPTHLESMRMGWGRSTGSRQSQAAAVMGEERSGMQR